MPHSWSTESVYRLCRRKKIAYTLSVLFYILGHLKKNLQMIFICVHLIDRPQELFFWNFFFENFNFLQIFAFLSLKVINLAIKGKKHWLAITTCLKAFIKSKNIATWENDGIGFVTPYWPLCSVTFKINRNHSMK